MPVYKQSSKIGQIYKGGTKIGKVYKGSTLVYSSARTVTYVIDSGNTVPKAVGNGADAISNAPAASKSGWSFVGWRSDTSADGSVHSSYAVNSDGIVLYAVFARTIYLYYNGNGATGGGVGTQSGTQYYNNGNTSSCSFQVQGNGFSRPGYTFVGWSTRSGGGVEYNPGSWITLGDSYTLYAVYVASSITINYWNSGSYPYVFTGGNYSDDGWKEIGYAGNCLAIQDIGNGYINWWVDLTYYKTLTVTFQGVWFNHEGTIRVGVGNNGTGGSFIQYADLAYPDAHNSSSGSVDISWVTGAGLIKFQNLSYKTCGISSITLSA